MRSFHRSARESPTPSTAPFTSRDGAPTSVLGVALPVGFAVGAYGLSYGVLAVAAGLSPIVATLSSVLVLAGASQFAFVGVLAAGGAPLTGALAGLLVNVRLVAFGLAIARRLPPAPLPRRLVDSYLVVDESVALAVTGPEDEVPRRFRWVGIAVVVSWIGATAIGAYGGQLLGDPRAIGLDAAFPAGFLALLAPWLRRRDGRIAAVVGVLLALGLTPFTPPGVPIIAAGLGAFVAIAVVRDGPDGSDTPDVAGAASASDEPSGDDDR